MQVSVISPPMRLVEVPAAKMQAPVLADDDDLRVEALLSAAQSRIERAWIGRAFGMQTLELLLDGLDEREIALPWPPLRSVTSITYLDEAGQERTVDPASYFVFGVGTRCGSVAPIGGRWPKATRRPESVRIRFEAGYAANDLELNAPRHAVVLIATHLRSLSTQDLSLRSDTVEGVGAQQWTVSDAAEALIRLAVEDLLADFVVWSC